MTTNIKTFNADARIEWSEVIPSLGMTFNDFLIEVSLLGGLGYYGANSDEEAQVPVDIHDLDQCKRIVNNALRQFIAEGPMDGWQWIKKRTRITFAPNGDGPDNVDGNPDRYLLPIGFCGSFSGPITYDTNTNNIPYIDWVSEATLRQYRSSTTYTGDPKWAAVRQGAQQGRWEFLVYPYPSRAYTIVFNWTLTQNKLVNLTDTTPMGALYDNDFLECCLARAEMEFEDVESDGHIVSWSKTNKLNAWKLDSQSTPRRLGTNDNQGKGFGYMRNWFPVTYNGE
jgi:hypothetical protein